MSRQKELDADPKAIQQVLSVEQLKHTDGVTADANQTMFVLTILGEINQARLKSSKGRGTVL